MPKRRLPLPHIYINILKGRTSVSAHCCAGSITVEAAMAVPIFFFGVIAFLYLMEMMCIQTAVRSGIQDAAKTLMSDATVVTLANPTKLESDIVNAIGAERLERSIVEGGSAGIDCRGSYLSPLTGIGEVTAQYKIRIPLPMFHAPIVEYSDSMKVKAWTGYENSGLDKGDEEKVYVAENGIVYHKDAQCTYLELSIQMVTSSEIENLRNAGGEKYHSCEKCAHGNSGNGKGGNGAVYITNQGNRYHNSLSCSGLKRTVYSVPLSEAIGKRACSKCTK